MNTFSLRGIGLVRKKVRVDAGSVQNNWLALRQDLPADKFLRIACVLEEHSFCPLDRHAVEESGDGSDRLSLKGCPQALNVYAAGDPHHAAKPGTVDVGLDGVGDDHIGSFFPKQLSVEEQKFEILERIKPPSIDGGLNAAKTGMLEVCFMPNKGHADDDFPLLLQFLQKGQPKLPKHIGMIGQDKKLHFSLLSSERGDGDLPSA